MRWGLFAWGSRASVGASLVALTACTLLVPIDDDLSANVGVSPEASSIDMTLDAGADALFTAPDSSEPFGPARDGCPNGVSLDPGLEAYYPFDENGGKVLHDCSSKARDLDSLGDVVPRWSADGRVHGAGDFDGTAGCFGAKDPKLLAFERQSFSVSVWVMPRQLFEGGNTGRWIIGHKISPKGWHLGVDAPDRLELDLEWSAPTNTKTEIAASGIPTTEWTHFVATYSNEGEAAVYRNGKLTEKIANKERVPDNFGTGDNVLLRIGCRNASGGVFDGKIDDLRIYSRVIDESLIQQLFEAR